MKSSGFPAPASFFHAILTVLSKSPAGVRRRNVHEPVADLMHLTSAQRSEVLPSGAHLRYQHRLGWGFNMLKTAGYVESPAIGIWKLTQKGIQLLQEHPNGIEDHLRRKIVRESQLGTDSDENEENSNRLMSPGSVTPDEKIQAAIDELNAALAKDLLQSIAQAPPAFFEMLVLDLLYALGYGSSTDNVQHVGCSGDGGIDGIISLDKLGLEKVYVQAKRWQGQVGRPDVQAFFGALTGRKAKKGVFITTSRFSREAKEFGEQISDSVVLIDGARLTSLMIESGVGVNHKSIKIARIDSEYFADS